MKLSKTNPNDIVTVPRQLRRVVRAMQAATDPGEAKSDTGSKRPTGEAWVTSKARRRNEIAIAAASMPLVLPVLAAGLALSRLLDGPNPLYSQERVGKDGKLFKMYKVRTMPGVEDNTPSLGAHDDRRSRLGKILGVTAADETPQFIQILTGDLALHGPRAVVPSEMEHMEEVLAPGEYPGLFEEWKHVYLTNGPGFLSSYNLAAHGRARNLEESYMIRATYDIVDFRMASQFGDMAMLASAGITVGRVLTQAITGHQAEPLSVQYLE